MNSFNRSQSLSTSVLHLYWGNNNTDLPDSVIVRIIRQYSWTLIPAANPFPDPPQIPKSTDKQIHRSGPNMISSHIRGYWGPTKAAERALPVFVKKTKVPFWPRAVFEACKGHMRPLWPLEILLSIIGEHLQLCPAAQVQPSMQVWNLRWVKYPHIWGWVVDSSCWYRNHI